MVWALQRKTLHKNILKRVQVCTSLVCILLFLVLCRYVEIYYRANQYFTAAQTSFRRYLAPTNQNQSSSVSVCHNFLRANTNYAVVSTLFLGGYETDRYIQGLCKLGTAVRRFAEIDAVLLLFSVTELANDRRTQSRIDAIVLRCGWSPCYVDAIDGPRWVTPRPDGKFENKYLETKAYSKLNILRLCEYSAVLYLDLDTLLIRQFSALFEEELPAMIASGHHLAMGINTFPNGTDYNAGVVLLRPNQQMFRELVSSISSVPHDIAVAEQALLNKVYSGRIFSLPFKYNSMVSVKAEFPQVWGSGSDIVILHYTCKPWNVLNCWNDGIEDLCQLWYLYS
jgi:alpha-N-acetylglucosamine transferase